MFNEMITDGSAASRSFTTVLTLHASSADALKTTTKKLSDTG